ncbi:hypothetical protein B0H17DRAFT_1145805 [Mycena rosella]|uniref:Uncharacterized protein n=1 Tax=Mycena rosella TaxID=1033263 RepID=A0AAD7G1Y8_MYCRO|nr:hypothetical protein B0H17DRAFT_1145805 [Mycena rosella]
MLNKNGETGRTEGEERPEIELAEGVVLGIVRGASMSDKLLGCNFHEREEQRSVRSGGGVSASGKFDIATQEDHHLEHVECLAGEMEVFRAGQILEDRGSYTALTGTSDVGPGATTRSKSNFHQADILADARYMRKSATTRLPDMRWAQVVGKFHGQASVGGVGPSTNNNVLGWACWDQISVGAELGMVPSEPGSELMAKITKGGQLGHLGRFCLSTDTKTGKVRRSKREIGSVIGAGDIASASHHATAENRQGTEHVFAQRLVFITRKPRIRDKMLGHRERHSSKARNIILQQATDMGDPQEIEVPNHHRADGTGGSGFIVTKQGDARRLEKGAPSTTEASRAVDESGKHPNILQQSLCKGIGKVLLDAVGGLGPLAKEVAFSYPGIEDLLYLKRAYVSHGPRGYTWNMGHRRRERKIHGVGRRFASGASDAEQYLHQENSIFSYAGEVPYPGSPRNEWNFLMRPSVVMASSGTRIGAPCKKPRKREKGTCSYQVTKKVPDVRNQKRFHLGLQVDARAGTRRDGHVDKATVGTNNASQERHETIGLATVGLGYRKPMKVRGKENLERDGQRCEPTDSTSSPSNPKRSTSCIMYIKHVTVGVGTRLPGATESPRGIPGLRTMIAEAVADEHDHIAKDKQYSLCVPNHVGTAKVVNHRLFVVEVQKYHFKFRTLAEGMDGGVVKVLQQSKTHGHAVRSEGGIWGEKDGTTERQIAYFIQGQRRYRHKDTPIYSGNMNRPHISYLSNSSGVPSAAAEARASIRSRVVTLAKRCLRASLSPVKPYRR